MTRRYRLALDGFECITCGAWFAQLEDLNPHACKATDDGTDHAAVYIVEVETWDPIHHLDLRNAIEELTARVLHTSREWKLDAIRHGSWIIVGRENVPHALWCVRKDGIRTLIMGSKLVDEQQQKL